MSSNNYLCKKCKKKVMLDKIRYDVNGVDLICVDCYDSKANKPATNLDTEREERHINSGERIKVICTDCRYKFSLRVGSNANLRCPYCSGNSLVKDQTSAEDIINEVASKPELYNF